MRKKFTNIKKGTISWYIDEHSQLGGSWGRCTEGGGAGLATAGCFGPVFDPTFMVVVVKVDGDEGGATV